MVLKIISQLLKISLLISFFSIVVGADYLTTTHKSSTFQALEKDKIGAHKVMESFEDGIPQEMYSIGGSLSLDSMRMKHGKRSLKWNWVGNGKLIMNRDLGYHPQRTIDIRKDSLLKDLRGGGKTGLLVEPPRGFFLWIYNPEARPQRLRFQFGRGEKVDVEFDYNLNFKGWRTLWIIYEKGDMMGIPHKDMDRMTILAPNIGKGTFYIDAIGTSLPMNFRQNTPNPQLPNIDPHPRLVSNYEHRLYEWSKIPPTLEIKPLSNTTKVGLNNLDKYLEDYLMQSVDKSGSVQSKLEDVKKRYADFKIIKVGNEIFGRSLMSANIYFEYFEQGGIPHDELKDEFYSWYTHGALLRDIANLYHTNSDQKVLDELTEMFLNLFDYGVDQGIDVGVGLGWIHHYTHKLSKYSRAVFLMRDVLEKHGRRDQAIDIVKWFSGFNKVYNENVLYGVEGRKGIDADDAGGVLVNKLISVMTMANTAEKDRDLRQFSTYFSNVYAQPSNALDDGMKTDGTTFHHATHTLSYGVAIANGLTKVLYLLSQSPYRVSESAHLNIKRVVNTLFFIQGPNTFLSPTTFTTTRFKALKIPASIHLVPAFLALSGSPDGSEKVDKEMANYAIPLLKLSAKRYIHNFNGSINQSYAFPDARSKIKISEINFLLKKINDGISGLTPKAYDGVRILPFSASAVKRDGNNWMASVRAHSKYVVPFESWGGGKYLEYPLFIANGYLDISYPKSIDSATPGDDDKRWHSGYDWHRWPGTTTVRLPYDQMITMPSQVRSEGGEYLFSDQAFCGGVESENGHGIFSFSSHGHEKYHIESLKAKKSYFMFGDKIICLGTGIESNLSGLSTETTLFQDALFEQSVPTQLNEEGRISIFPFEKILSKTSPSWLIDSRGTGFYIPKTTGGTTLKFTRKEQTSPDQHAEKDVKGDFATALFDHGSQPNGASYNYIVVPNVDAVDMESFAKQMKRAKVPVKVIQQNNEAHVVEAPFLGLTGYVTFNALTTFKKGPVAIIEHPAIVLVEEKNHQDMVLNVTNPDLNIYDGQDDLLPDGTRTELSIYEREWFYWPSRPTYVEVTLRGKWIVENKSQKIALKSSKQKLTIIEVECTNGQTQCINLKRSN